LCSFYNWTNCDSVSRQTSAPKYAMIVYIQVTCTTRKLSLRNNGLGNRIYSKTSNQASDKSNTTKCTVS
jgi:hypothetical protein